MVLEYPRDMLTRIAAEKNLEILTDDMQCAANLLDTLFFASLMIDESESVKIAIVYHVDGAAGLAKVVDASPENTEDPSLAWDVTTIVRKPFNPPELTKLSRGVKYGSQLIVVGGAVDEFWIDGIARVRRRTDGGSVIRLAAPRPGVLIVERGLTQILRFEAGRQMLQPIDVLGRTGPVRKAIAAITKEQYSETFDNSGFYSFSESALRRLIKKMRGTGSGAILALLAQEPDEDALHPVRYRRIDPMLLPNRIEVRKLLGLRRISKDIFLNRDAIDAEQLQERDIARNAADLADEELEAALDDIAALSAIDGAILGGPRLAIYGAGYIIPSSQLLPDKIRRARDPRGETSEEYPSRHGARHSAGFSLAYQKPGAVAFIISEDGPVSCAFRVNDHVLVWPVEVLET